MGLGLKSLSASLLRAVWSQTMQLYKRFELFSVDTFQPTFPTWKALKLTRYTQGIYKGYIRYTNKVYIRGKKFCDKQIQNKTNFWRDYPTVGLKQQRRSFNNGEARQSKQQCIRIPIISSSVLLDQFIARQQALLNGICEYFILKFSLLSRKMD